MRRNYVWRLRGGRWKKSYTAEVTVWQWPSHMTATSGTTSVYWVSPFDNPAGEVQS